MKDLLEIKITRNSSQWGSSVPYIMNKMVVNMAASAPSNASEMECIEYCKLELIRKERKCVDFFNYYPHNEPLCETGCEDVLCSGGYKDINNMSLSLVKFGKICADKCRPGCDQNVYEVTKEEIQVPEELIETFCYLGGYVGIWLGISLVAIFDFVESIIIILRHPYKRIKNRFNSKIKPFQKQEYELEKYY
ncbi:amiloride-sensitive sodium channel subunit alpha [Trichonephila clavipes]|nr:amiloride-sensitive sodium channel subunit alpha [Trichonephila clavipes]